MGAAPVARRDETPRRLPRELPGPIEAARHDEEDSGDALARKTLADPLVIGGPVVEGQVQAAARAELQPTVGRDGRVREDGANVFLEARACDIVEARDIAVRENSMVRQDHVPRAP